ncbi:DNA cytosine methyltransferase [Streptomyces sp. NBC_01373]|uniref:DNA cytosine methyltransferase n=1 Tax=Streptomyces sp. NBC_01373 TaxID=2903843 RepID=UPI0022575F4E|nr:DNA cytosine methyltransferase [Streptomyces sp. NBC_01373]MCX4697041.1 DNA cytosine methyltransferase [Streptomyces sp. NBC_01373]MCX4707034.1 DNA cytosine methyltransferase [Streptomyces sp. NBC_01373]
MNAPVELVELFAGAGGLGAGAEDAGIYGQGIEWDVNAVATRRAAGLPTIHADVRRHGPADFPRARILAGGPPCQTFTIAGYGAGRAVLADILDAVKRMGARETVDPQLLGDERTSLVLEPLRWILEALDAGRPFEAVVLEQVQQVQQVQQVWNAYAEVLRAEGYDVATGVLRTEQYGLSQTRRRAVLVARLGIPVALPTPTHRPYKRGVPQHEGDPALKPWVSMGEALNRPEPFTVISNYGTGGDPKNRGRRTSSEPAATVTGKISRFRIVDSAGNEQPRFTHSEAGRLQGFPADWPWSGNDIAQQVGNACPVPLAAALAQAVTAPTATAGQDLAPAQAA